VLFALSIDSVDTILDCRCVVGYVEDQSEGSEGEGYYVELFHGIHDERLSELILAEGENRRVCSWSLLKKDLWECDQVGFT
jgi:hypothetical protein